MSTQANKDLWQRGGEWRLSRRVFSKSLLCPPQSRPAHGDWDGWPGSPTGVSSAAATSPVQAVLGDTLRRQPPTEVVL